MKNRKFLCVIFVISLVALLLCACNKDDTVKYSVVFDSNGGSFIPTVTVEEGYAVAKPDDPTWEGHIFKGWYSNGVLWSFADTVVTEDLVLEAQWAEAFTVTFDTDGGTQLEPITVEAGSKLTKPTDPQKDEHTFLGWYVSENAWNFEVNTVNANVTLKAKWIHNSELPTYHSVTFIINGGVTDAGDLGERIILDGAKITEPKAPTKAGYAFDGWFFGGVAWSFDTDTVTESVVLTAKWTKLYSVSFDSNGGSPVESIDAREGEPLPLPTAPTRAGYRFDGWYLGDEEWDLTAPITEEITLTAKWLTLHTVAFDSNGGSTVDAAEVVSGEKLVAPVAPTKDGFKFDGWYLEGNAWDFDYNTVGASITLTAKWIPYYTVIFDTDGGSTIENVTLLEGELCTRPENPTKVDYIFKGWTLDGNPWSFDTPITANITVKAVWEEESKLPTECTVSFDLNGGVGNADTETKVVAGGSLLAEPLAPTREGYVFVGWYVGANAWNFALDQVVVEELTLTAVWKKACTVIFDTNGSTDVIPNATYAEGELITEPTEPTRDGYVFDGWHLENEAWSFDEPVTDSITLVAAWRKIHTVTFDPDNGTDTKTESVVDGDTVEAPTEPTKEGYRFDGWYFGENKWDFSNEVNSDTALIAKWVKTYTVSFDTNGSSDVIESVKADEGGHVTPPTAPTLVGYEFDGWYFGDLLWSFDENTVCEDITLVAKWAKVYTVVINFNCSEAPNPIVIYVREGEKIVLTDIPVRENGDIIYSWHVNSTIGPVWNMDEDVVTEDVTLKAKWGKTGVTVTPGGTIITKPDDFTNGQGNGNNENNDDQTGNDQTGGEETTGGEE